MNAIEQEQDSFCSRKINTIKIVSETIWYEYDFECPHGYMRAEELGW